MFFTFTISFFYVIYGHLKRTIGCEPRCPTDLLLKPYVANQMKIRWKGKMVLKENSSFQIDNESRPQIRVIFNCKPFKVTLVQE